MADRAIVFIDGNNWFHALRSVGVEDRARLDYKRISEKLLGPREWIGTRYYIGQLSQQENATRYADQRAFLAALQATDPRITVHLGRIEQRTTKNDAALELRQYLSRLPTKIDAEIYAELAAIAKRHEKATVFVEKAVDVFLAVDFVSLAIKNAYDAAYLLSADGDFTPAVEAARLLNKKVYAACPMSGAQIGRAVNAFIHLSADWFDDCYKP